MKEFHLIVDGYDCKKERLKDKEFIYKFLDELPTKINMQKIIPPYVFEYKENKENWGITGFVIIAESHISVHTFVEKKIVNIDIFSCKEFDKDEALRYVVEYFKLKKYDTKFLERGNR